MAAEAAASHVDDTYLSTRLDQRAGELAYALLRERLGDRFLWCTEDQEEWGQGPADAELIVVADPVDGTAFSPPGRPDYGACCLTVFDRASNCLACAVADLYSPTVFWCQGLSGGSAHVCCGEVGPQLLQIPVPYPRRRLADGCFVAGVLMKPDRLQRDRRRLDALADYLVRREAERAGSYRTLLALAFGGSPTIARVAATGLTTVGNGGTWAGPAGVDVCFDLVGGRFHDLAGPVALARAAGAVAVDLDGRDLALAVPGPDEREERHPFVVAASRELAEEFLMAIAATD